MSRILWKRSKRVSEVGGEESAHLPPKRGSYVMRVCAIVGRSWLREFPTTGFGHVARWGSRRRPRTGIGYAVISRRRVLEERATGNQYLCTVRDHDQALIYINRKICGKDERTYDLFQIWNNCAQKYVVTWHLCYYQTTKPTNVHHHILLQTILLQWLSNGHGLVHTFIWC